jgi:hypothetical protein
MAENLAALLQIPVRLVESTPSTRSGQVETESDIVHPDLEDVETR